jgi:non-ribosomal peptide synthetase component F
MLPLRTELSHKNSFIDIINRIKETTFLIQSNQEYPFEKIIEDLKIVPEQSRSPLFDIILNVDEETINRFSLIYIELHPNININEKYKDIALVENKLSTLGFNSMQLEPPVYSDIYLPLSHTP